MRMIEEEKEQIRNDGDPHRKCALPVVPDFKLVVVGYALTSKKIKSFLQPKLEDLARNKGILFVAIDQSIPLSDQGPFDIVLHKLSGKEWRHVLEVDLVIEYLHLLLRLLQCLRKLRLDDTYKHLRTVIA